MVWAKFKKLKLHGCIYTACCVYWACSFSHKTAEKQAKYCEFRFFALLNFNLFFAIDNESIVESWRHGYRNIPCYSVDVSFLTTFAPFLATIFEGI